MKAAATIVFATRAGRMALLRNTLLAFGVISAFVQFYGAVFVPDNRLPAAEMVFIGGLALALVYGIVAACPRQRVSRVFASPDFRVTVTRGDLFDETHKHIVVGFTDTFDTDVAGDRVIHRSSVQGQLLERVYSGEAHRLDTDLAQALDGRSPVCTEQASDKQEGKRDRYALGSVLTLRAQGRVIYAAAYSRMSNDLVARGTVDSIWQTLGAVWETVGRTASLYPIAVPVVGSELARVGSFGREGLIKLILTSFIAHSRRDVVSRELVVVVHDKDFPDMNMTEIADFIRAL